ncbi:hypothetical protein [Prochlorococcus marinus]|uniref:hypothetical protein n=1 Tax=Prochlorococcus marinus TaxID=1219 RepID=UPI0022B3B24C|nr:hypothetical protein [Prochlorococcus marinus]
MSYESGSLECRRLIESKENLLKVIKSLECFDNIDEINKSLKTIYQRIEEMHEERRRIEYNN